MQERASGRILYLASNNRHKLEELKALLHKAPGEWDVRLARTLDPEIGWDETGKTFEDNARIKTLAVRAKLTAPACILADDSGLTVDALNGAPGVLSSRFAGVEGDDGANNAKLLLELEDVPSMARKARFVCVLCFVDESGTERFYRGECKGRILTSPRGKHGFGYDPLFLVEGTERAMAEMSEDEKNEISHRRRAVDAWLVDLR